MGLPAPYLYVTVHDEVKNVIKYSRNGCLISDSVLKDGPLNKHSELRSIVIHSFNGSDGALYVSDSYIDISAVYVYSPCDTLGQRSYVATVLASDPEAVHSYGIGFDDDDNIYISYQDTDNVLRLKYSNVSDTFQSYPYQSPLPPGYANGTFYQFGQPGVHKSSEQGVRSVIGVYNNNTNSTDIWIANEDINEITIVSSEGAVLIETINITSPIGLYFSKSDNLVFACGKGSKKASVLAFDASTYKLEKTFLYSNLTHPAGLVSYGDVLFVNEQDLNQILSFNITTEEFISVVVATPPGSLEQLALCVDSQC